MKFYIKNRSKKTCPSRKLGAEQKHKKVSLAQCPEGQQPWPRA